MKNLLSILILSSVIGCGTPWVQDSKEKTSRLIQDTVGQNIPAKKGSNTVKNNKETIKWEEELVIEGRYIEWWKPQDAKYTERVEYDSINHIKKTILKWTYVEDGKYEHIKNKSVKWRYIEIKWEYIETSD